MEAYVAEEERHVDALESELGERSSSLDAAVGSVDALIDVRRSSL
jgi:hypothetical protein